MSPWTLRSRLTVTRLVTVVCPACVSSLFYTACCHTYKKFTHTVDSSGETERHNSGIVDFPASHRLEAARPPTNLPPTSLLRGYRPQRVVVVSISEVPLRLPPPLQRAGLSFECRVTLHFFPAARCCILLLCMLCSFVLNTFTAAQ